MLSVEKRAALLRLWRLAWLFYRAFPVLPLRSGNVPSFGQFKQELAEFLDEADSFAENAVLNPPVAAFTEQVREEQG